MKRTLFMLAAAALMLCSCKGNSQPAVDTTAVVEEGATVYMTTEITPQSLIKIYEALGVKAEGRVAVKISSGEGGNTHYLQPALIGDFVKSVNGTLVECNTAYPGTRMDTKAHWKTIREHGFLDIAPFDLMDEEGTMQIPVVDTTHIKYDIVGSHLANYDFMINLAHFKGHAMGGYGGVLKNQSIGVASTAGKLYIHSAGRSTTEWIDDDQDGFLESMAAASQGVHNYFTGRNGIVYINVMNNISIDCDCDGNPHAPELKNIGILASTDPVALDQACLDLVYNHKNTEGDDNTALIQRIEKQHGIHTVEHAEKIGLGTRKYHIVSID
ncbi:MAG: DUF362 domain-containing protein [Bacteroidales bacterium]|nr:DUF362 domain-containing protein [Bacteroidales bacterium]